MAGYMTSAVASLCILAVMAVADDGGRALRDSEERARELVSAFPRRMRRDADQISAAFNLYGIVLSISLPAVGAIPSILAAILPLIFESPGISQQSIKQLIAREVRDERIEQLRRKLINFHNTAESIGRHARENNQTSVYRLMTLYDNLNNDRCQFMRMDDVGNIAAYFGAFAKIHLVVNQLLVVAYPTERHWLESRAINARDYATYAHHVVQMIPSNELQPVRDELKEAMGNWTKLLPLAEQKQFIDGLEGLDYDVKYDEPIAFKRNGQWFECKRPFTCGYGSCLGDGSSTISPPYTHCFTSVHFISPIGNLKSLTTCDRVLIHGASIHDFLYVRWIFWNRAGSSRETYEDSHLYRWIIQSVDNPNKCHVPIKDRERVYLVGHDGKGPMAPYEGAQQEFTIYRVSNNTDYRHHVPACINTPHP